MKKKKILLLSDDLRMSSGVGTMSREIVMGTIKEYDWVQVAGAIKHPDAGKIVDLNQATREETGIEDAYLKLYPVDGYGSQELLRTLIKNRTTRCYSSLYGPKILDLVVWYGTRVKTTMSYFLL